MLKLYQIVRSCLTVCLMVGAVSAFAQNKTVTGKVTSSDDAAGLPGVNIIEKGTTNGTVTDADGSFKIDVPENATLVFSFIGYVTQETPVGTQTALNVALSPDVKTLSEVVVVGYGMQEKKDVTGSIVAVGTKDLNRGIISSPQDMMLGKVAGVQITSNDGSPGAGATIRIRGTTSLGGSSDPLIIIDGFPVDNPSSVPGTSNPLSLLNPQDIETFTVLKDASATAIYGLRAASGVIIITTKKGKEGKVEAFYNGQVSVSTPAKLFPVMTGDEFRATANAELAAGLPGLSQAAVNRLGTANTNWQKQIFQNAVTLDNNLGVSGTINGMPYRISAGLTDNNGLVKTTSFVRKSVNINLNPTLLDGDLAVTASFKGSNTISNFGNSGAVGAATNYDPTQPVRNGNTKWGGYYTYVTPSDTLANGKVDPNGTPITIGSANPVALLNQTHNVGNLWRGLGSLKLEYRVRAFPALKLTANGGFDYSSSTGYNNSPTNAAFTYGSGLGQVLTYSGINRSKLLDLYANYSKRVGNHNVDVTAGYSYQDFERSGASLTRNIGPPVNYTNATVVYNPDGSIKGYSPVAQVPLYNTLIGFFARANYSYADKYLLTVSGRNDESSRYSKANRSYWFTAAAVGWRINKEAFMSSVTFISDLKLRGSYGTTGNQDVTGLGNSSAQNPSYPYLALYQLSNSQAQYQFGSGTVNTQRPQAYDPNIKWESTAQSDVGLDFGFLSNRITGTFDVYQKDTKNLLGSIPVAAGSNLSNYIVTNVGSMQNKGFELGLKAVAVKTQDFEWNIGYNLAHNQNMITKLLKNPQPGYEGVFVGNISGGVGTTIQNLQVGYPVNSFYVFQQVYNGQGNPVEGLYVDKTGQGGQVIANNDNKIRYHSPQAKYLMGLNTRLTYKQWDFYASGRVSLGNYVYNNNQSSKAFYASMYNQAGFFSNLPTGISDTKFVQPQYYSSYYVQNASFFKMDNISLGYSFKELFTPNLKGRLSFTVNNAFWITKYKGQDPDVLNGIDNNIYPRPRVFLVGLNVMFK